MRKEFLELLPEIQLFKNDSYHLYVNQSNEIVLLTGYGEEINLGKKKYDYYEWNLGLSVTLPEHIVLYKTPRFSIVSEAGVYLIYERDEKNSAGYTIAYKLFKVLGEVGR